MKNIFLAAALVLTLSSCKKDQVENDSNTEVTTDASPTSIPDAKVAVPAAQLRQISAQEASTVLQQTNDTLYVTNFFATWCGPCIKEIPHFKAKMASMKGQPVKFTFVSLDDPSDWDSAVRNFTEDNGLVGNTVLLDGAQLTPEWFSENFRTWTGEAIPFTFMKKGAKTDEYMGAMSPELLDSKIAAFR